MINGYASVPYSPIHSVLKVFGAILHIRLKYGCRCLSIRCYVTSTSDAEKDALEGINSMNLRENNLTADVIRLNNVAHNKIDYCPNVFDDAGERPPKARIPPTPHWFVAYYRKGRGNFIHAAKYLEKGIGVLPRNIIKKYGKRVLIKA